jgi:hypothetical protein
MAKLSHLAILFGGFCLLTASPALSQYPNGYGNLRPQNRGPFATTTYAAPRVSPYVNLGVGSNGLSNYQTLVRPQIVERELLERQSAELEQLNQRIRGTMASQALREPEQNLRPGQSRVRFMDYSRYFGTVR